MAEQCKLTLSSGFAFLSSVVVAWGPPELDVWATLTRKHCGRIVDRIQRDSVFNKEWLSNGFERWGITGKPCHK